MRAQPVVTGAVAFLAFVALAPSSASAAPVDTAPPQIWGHRGVNIPGVDENTLAAFARTIADGADGGETDVRWTKDGHMVLLHDATLDRTTDCTGKVTSHSYAYVKTCLTPTGQHVPTFNAALEYVATTDRPLMAEVKASTITKKQARQYVAALAHFHMTERTIAHSLHSQPVRRLRQASTAPLATGIDASTANRSVSDIRSLGGRYIVRLSLLTDDEAAALRTAGITSYAWDIKTRADLDRVRDLRIEGAIVDDPAAARAIWG